MWLGNMQMKIFAVPIYEWLSSVAKLNRRELLEFQN